MQDFFNKKLISQKLVNELYKESKVPYPPLRMGDNYSFAELIVRALNAELLEIALSEEKQNELLRKLSEYNISAAIEKCVIKGKHLLLIENSKIKTISWASLRGANHFDSATMVLPIFKIVSKVSKKLIDSTYNIKTMSLLSKEHYRKYYPADEYSDEQLTEIVDFLYKLAHVFYEQAKKEKRVSQ